MALEIATGSDVGGRDEQQDRIAALRRDDATLLVLADGMGGHEGGALAAQAVVDVAREIFDGPKIEDGGTLLARICLGAHGRINAIGADHGIQPHSTCVLLHIAHGAATWAHVGDSRLYRFKACRLVERTVDHSIVELLRLQGRISEDEMKSHPDRSRLYQALGGSKPPEVEMGSTELRRNSGFVLASDGFWEHIREDELAELLEAPDLAAALPDLVATAKSRGGDRCDNISVITARCRPLKASLTKGFQWALSRWIRV